MTKEIYPQLGKIIDPLNDYGEKEMNSKLIEIRIKKAMHFLMHGFFYFRHTSVPVNQQVKQGS